MAGMRRQPQGRVQIDWNNPITRGLVFAFATTATGIVGYGSNGTNSLPFVASFGGQVGNAVGAAVATPAGWGAKTLFTNQPIATIPDFPAIQSSSFSLFALATASAAVLQSAIDDDDGTTRRYQFRLNNGKVEFIPFNSSGAQTVATSTALVAADLARGFTMGATAGPGRYAVFQNGQVASATPSGTLLTPTAKPTLGMRKFGNQAWATGGLSLLCSWSRTLADDEMRSLAANPWQLFAAADDDDDTAATSLGAYTLSAASGSFSMTATAVGVHAGRKLQADQGALALAAVDAGIRALRRLPTDTTSFAMSGGSAPILSAHKLATNAGVFGVTGTTAPMVAARRLAAQPGAFVLSPGGIQMLYAPAPGPSGPTYTLAVNSGVFELAVAAATLLVGRRLPADVGAFAMAGALAALRAGRRMTAEASAFGLVGAGAQLRYTAQVSYARALSGAGYVPQQHYNESRPAATSSPRPAATQRNFR